MTAVHTATSGPLITDLVEAVLAEFDTWAEHAAAQAASLYPSSPPDAARSALMDVRQDLSEHVQIRLATALATYGIGGSGVVG